MSVTTITTTHSKLAVLGGMPVRSEPFPSWPYTQPGMKEHLIEVLESGQWGCGSPFITEIETAFAEFIGVPYCHSCVNGTQAIQVALQALGIEAGDEVLTTPYTFFGTITPIMALGAIPRFVDISESSFLMDLNLLEAAITEHTKAIIVVHLAGCPMDMDRVIAIASRYGLGVIEDSAQAHGAEWKGKRVGSWGDLGTFSFQTSKNMSAGEGGAVTTRDESLSNKVYGAKNCGRIPGGLWYQHETYGSNLRLSAFQAAILRNQINHVDAENRKREENASYLRELLQEVDGIDFVAFAPEGVTSHARHLVLLRYDSQAFEGLSRDRFLAAAEAEGIPIASGYVPLYQQGAMHEFSNWSIIHPVLRDRGIDYSDSCLPVTERISKEEGMWIPQNVLLGSKLDIESIVEAFMKVREGAGELMSQR